MSSVAAASRYPRTLIGLHWLTLLLLAAVYACIELRGNFPRGSAIRDGLKEWHYALGLVVFVLLWLRVTLRLHDPRLIGLHAAAALYHHYWLRDATLRRMLPERGR